MELRKKSIIAAEGMQLFIKMRTTLIFYTNKNILINSLSHANFGVQI